MMNLKGSTMADEEYFGFSKQEWRELCKEALVEALKSGATHIQMPSPGDEVRRSRVNYSRMRKVDAIEHYLREKRAFASYDEIMKVLEAGGAKLSRKDSDRYRAIR